MEINYYIVLPVGLLIVLLILWLMRRNAKDKKDYVKMSNESDIKPEKHEDTII